MLTIGDLELAHKVPRIAVGFTDNNSVEKLFELKKNGLDIAELRVDLFQSFDMENLKEEAAKFKKVNLPSILTVRSSAEGGKWHKGYLASFKIARELLADIDSVDIELASLLQSEKEALSLIDDIHNLDKTVISSYHNFDSTPSYHNLEKVVCDGKAANSDIVKIATTVNSYDDLETLVRLTIAHKDKNLIIIGMGDIGLISRLMLPSLGSLITFAYANEMPTAPGQLRIDVLIDLLRQFYPEYNQEKVASL